MSFKLKSLASISLFLLASCTTNSDGSKTPGMKGSAIWHKFASIEEKVAYFAPTCKALGFTEGTTDFSRCIQTEMSDDRSAALQQVADISEAFEKMKPQPTPNVTCRTYGSITRCN